jgi:hemerythrin-like domain-containing protein
MGQIRVDESDEGRRHFLCALAATAGLALTRCATTSAARGQQPGAREHGEDSAEAEVTPGEDLMQEHGVVERILLLYDETARRIERGEAFDGAVVRSAADIVRRFVQDYHERSEEEFVFPRLEAARREVELVATLRRQHQRGREVTDVIVRLSGGPATGSAELARALRGFERMYRPHAAREDTVLFPAFREVVGRSAYHELGERFEATEHAHFGEHGFERTVAEIARLETALGIDDLARFTTP